MKTFQQFLEDVYLVENPISINPRLSAIIQRITGISRTGGIEPLRPHYPEITKQKATRIGVYTPPPKNSYTRSADRTGGTVTITIPEKDIKKITPKDLANPLNPKNIIPKIIPFA